MVNSRPRMFLKYQLLGFYETLDLLEELNVRID